VVEQLCMIFAGRIETNTKYILFLLLVSIRALLHSINDINMKEDDNPPQTLVLENHSDLYIVYCH
jgi:hypothetical protein